MKKVLKDKGQSMNKDKNQLWTLPFILVLAVNALNGISSYMVNPSMPQFLTAKGIPFALTGFISSLLSWVALGMRPFSGAMSDRLNKKKIMFVSYLATAVCMLGYAWVQKIPAVIGIRVLHGMAFAVSGTISMAFATSFVPEKRIAEGISYIGIATLLGTMIGPQLGSTISQQAGMDKLFLTAGLLCLICLLIIVLIPYPVQVPDFKSSGAKIKLSDLFAKELLVYVFLIGLFSFGNGIISYYLIDFGQVRGISSIAYFFTVYSVAMLLMKPFVGKLQDARGIRVILIPAFLIYALGMVLLAKAFSLTPVLIAAVFKAVGQGNGSPAIQAESVKTLGIQRSGVAISTCLFGQDLGNAIGPIFASYVVNFSNYGTMFMLYAMMLLAGLGVYCLSLKRENEKRKAVFAKEG